MSMKDKCICPRDVFREVKFPHNPACPQHGAKCACGLDEPGSVVPEDKVESCPVHRSSNKDIAYFGNLPWKQRTIGTEEEMSGEDLVKISNELELLVSLDKGDPDGALYELHIWTVEHIRKAVTEAKREARIDELELMPAQATPEGLTRHRQSRLKVIKELENQ